MRPTPAKAGLKNLQKADAKRELWRKDADACIVAIYLSRKSRKEVAGMLDLSESGLANQLAGNERPQTELFRANDILRGPFLVAVAMQDPELFDVVTTITVRRVA